nr:hypothetical protein CFP56_43836 [Quercus suber]
MSHIRTWSRAQSSTGYRLSQCNANLAATTTYLCTAKAFDHMSSRWVLTSQNLSLQWSLRGVDQQIRYQEHAVPPVITVGADAGLKYDRNPWWCMQHVTCTLAFFWL